MIKSKLPSLVLAGLLSAAALSAFADTSTGTTLPDDTSKTPAMKMGEPNKGVDMNNNAVPAEKATDPRIQGNDPGRQGGADSTLNKTTTGGSGSEGNGGAQGSSGSGSK